MTTRQPTRRLTAINPQIRFGSVVTILVLGAFAGTSAIAGASVRSARHRDHRVSHRRRVEQLYRDRASEIASQCADADTPAGWAARQSILDALVCLINQQRTARGLPPLGESAQLDHSAQMWTDEMVATGAFTHGAFTSRMSAVGYDWQIAGENIATGYETPREVVAAWMGSRAHCQNILDPSFRNVGSGVEAAPVGSWASGPATWTQDFGLLMSQRAPSSNTAPERGCPYTI